MGVKLGDTATLDSHLTPGPGWYEAENKALNHAAPAYCMAAKPARIEIQERTSGLSLPGPGTYKWG